MNEAESAFNLLYIDETKKWCEDKSKNPWVIFELADYYDINKVSFRDVAPYESGNGNVPEYWIYMSTTGVSDNDWHLVVHKTDQGNVDVKVDSFSSPINARFIKFVASKGVRTDNGQPENAIRIYGFDIFGELSNPIDRQGVISVGKSVIGFYDSKNFYEQPLHLFVGNLNSANCWLFDQAGTGDSLKYVILDLENEYDVEKFKLYDAGNFDSKAYNLNGYKIYVSTEKPDLGLITLLVDKNIVWTKVVDVNGVKIDNIKTNVINPIKARYVKLEIPRSRSSLTNKIYQFEIYKKNIQDGISDTGLSGVSIWPRILKSGDLIRIKIPEPAKLYVFSLQGNLLKEIKLNEYQNSITANFPTGCYLARVSFKNQSEKFKIIVL